MNFATIVIAAIVVLVFVAIVVNGIRKKKKGIHSCSCGGSCTGCGMHGSCHKS